MKWKNTFLVFFIVAILDSEACRPSADNILNLFKAEVDTYDRYVYSRSFLAERTTCDMAVHEDGRLLTHFSEELEVVLSRTQLQVKAITDRVRGTDAEACVANTNTIMQKTIEEESKSFQRCSSFSRNELRDWESGLNKDFKKYEDLKSRTKTSLRNCLLNFPGECATSATPCLKQQLSDFHATSRQLTENKSNNSLCMGELQETLQCFTKTAEKAVKITEQNLQKMKKCTTIFDTTSDVDGVDSFFSKVSLNATVVDQVRRSQKKFRELHGGILKKLHTYYFLEKTARKTYEFRPHDVDHFRQRMDQEFSKYLSRVDAVRRDKEYAWASGWADKCCDSAKAQISSIISQATSQSLECEKDILTETQLHINDIRENLFQVTERLSLMGNVAILACLKNGSILADNAVEGCYGLEYRAFQLETQGSLEKVDSLLEVLEKYNATYFSVSENNLPCGDNQFNRTKLSLDRVLFELNRCPYNRYDDVETTTSAVSTTSTTSTRTTTSKKPPTSTTGRAVPKTYLDADYSYFFENLYREPTYPGNKG